MYKDEMRLSLCDMNRPWQEVSETLVHNLRTGFGGCDECKVRLVDLQFQPSYRVIYVPHISFVLKRYYICLFFFSTFNDTRVIYATNFISLS